VIRDRARALAVPTLIVVVAGIVRFVLLGDPERIVFDETYYVTDALSYLEHAAETGFAVHPPVGKWLIALGIALLGDTAVGWRIAAAVAGTAVVLVVYLTARRLFPPVGAALAGLLVATDGLLIVQSRIAMLDIFLTLFVVLGAWFVLIDIDRLRQAGVTRFDLRRRRFLLAAGACFGLAVATKWSGIFALGAAGLVVLTAEVAARRRTTEPRGHRIGVLVGSLAIGIVVVPAAVYVLSHIPWLVGYPETHQAQTTDCRVDGEVIEPCSVGAIDRVRGAARHHVAVWRYHRDLEADHPYESHAWTWPLMSRPIVYYWESCPESRATDPAAEPCVVDEGNAAEIIALGNPALWWPALLALVPLGAGLLRRDRRAGFILAFWIVQYAPWVAVDRPLFFFYMTPVIPFMALGVAYATTWLDERRAPDPRPEPEAEAESGPDPDDEEPDRRIWRRRPGAVISLVIAIGAVALLVYFLPVLIGIEMDAGAVRRRWWFDSWV
jgi:dolichyl-phosphate-mannose-protein mannosyltransferase